jgi:predicted DNA-binding transcriptional regulator YafY
MDILNFGPHVEVVAPDSLRATVAEELRATLGRYSPSA